MLTSMLKDTLFPFYITEPAFPTVYSGWNCVIRESNKKCQVIQDKKWCEGMQKGREGNSSVTKYGNNSSLKPKIFLFERKCQPHWKPETINSESYCQVCIFLSLERKIDRWQTSCSCFCVTWPNCAHRHKQKDRSAG